MPRFLTSFLYLVVALLTATQGHAQSIVTFSDLSSFHAAVGTTGFTAEDFTNQGHLQIASLSINSQTYLPDNNIYPGTLQPGVTYSIAQTGEGGSFIFNIDAGGGFTGGFLDTGTEAGPLKVTFDQPAYAFGFDTNSLTGSSFSITIMFSGDTSSYSNSFTIPDTSGMSFFGFQSNAANIVSFTFGGGEESGKFAMDNFTFTAVPEPSTWLLMGFGFIGVVGVQWRARRAGTR